MGGRGSKSSNGKVRNSANGGKNANSDVSTYSTQGAVDKLNSAMRAERRSEASTKAKEAFKELREGNKIYSVREKNGVLENVTEIKKSNGVIYANGHMMEDWQFIDDVTHNRYSKFQTTKPETYSSFKMENRVSKTVDGMKLHKATYDVLGNENSKLRKFSKNGFIGTYDGMQFGIHKTDKGYVATHIDTGSSFGKPQKTYADAVKQIKDTSDTIKRIWENKTYNQKESLSRTIRGKE